MSDLAALAQTLRGLLGPGIGIGAGVTDPRADYGGLYPDETRATPRMVPARLLEFTAGRAAARAAMADLGHPPAPIPMGPDRAPIWPEGLVGSIAHCKSACIAAVAPEGQLASIGLDIEEATPLETELWDTVLSLTERNWIATQPDPGLAAKRIFCAKEVTYKAQYPLTGRMLGFEDVEITLGLDTFSATIDRERHIGGRLSRQGNFLIVHAILS